MKFYNKILTSSFLGLMIASSVIPLDSNRAIAFDYGIQFSSLETKVTLAAKYTKNYGQVKIIKSLNEENFDENIVYFLGNTFSNKSFVITSPDPLNSDTLEDFNCHVIRGYQKLDDWLYDVETDMMLVKFEKIEEKNKYRLNIFDVSDCESVSKKYLKFEEESPDEFAFSVHENESSYLDNELFKISFVDNQIKISFEVNESEYVLTSDTNNQRENSPIYVFADVNNPSITSYKLVNLYEYRPILDKSLYHDTYKSKSDLLDEKKFSIGMDEIVDHTEPVTYSQIGLRVLTGLDNSSKFLTSFYECDDLDSKVISDNINFSQFVLEESSSNLGKYVIKYGDSYLVKSEESFAGMHLITFGNKADAALFEVGYFDDGVYQINVCLKSEDYYLSYFGTKGSANINSLVLDSVGTGIYLIKEIDKTSNTNYVCEIATNFDAATPYEQLVYKVKCDIPFDLYSSIVNDPNIENPKFGLVYKKGSFEEQTVWFDTSNVNEDNPISEVFNFQIPTNHLDDQISTKLILTYSVMSNPNTILGVNKSLSTAQLAQKYLDDYSSDESVIAHNILLEQLASYAQGGN